MSTGPARRRGLEPELNGISAYRYMATDCMLRCGDALHEDQKYAAEVIRTRRLMQPSIARHLDAWIERRDGIVGETCTHCKGVGVIRQLGGSVTAPGFWVDPEGKPLRPGQPVPKDAYTGMEGAIMEILHLDGIYWIQSKPKRNTKGSYNDVLKKSKYADDKDGAEDDDEDEEG